MDLGEAKNVMPYILNAKPKPSYGCLLEWWNKYDLCCGDAIQAHDKEFKHASDIPLRGPDYCTTKNCIARHPPTPEKSMCGATGIFRTPQ